HLCVRFRARLSSIGLCALAVIALLDARAAFAGKVKMVFPGPVTTFSLPYLVAQQTGWLGDLELEDVHVTGDATARRVRLAGTDESTARFVQVGGHAARLQAVIGGRADATLVNTVTALKGVQDGKVTVLTKLSTEFPGLGYVWNVVRADALAKPELAAAFQTL